MATIMEVKVVEQTQSRVRKRLQLSVHSENLVIVHDFITNICLDQNKLKSNTYQSLNLVKKGGRGGVIGGDGRGGVIGGRGEVWCGVGGRSGGVSGGAGGVEGTGGGEV